MTRHWMKNIALSLVFAGALAHAPLARAGIFDDVFDAIADVAETVGEGFIEGMTVIGEGIAEAGQDFIKSPLGTLGGWVSELGKITDEALGGTGFISKIVDAGVKAASILDIPAQAIYTAAKSTISFAKSISEGDFGSAFEEAGEGFVGRIEEFGKGIARVGPIGIMGELASELGQIADKALGGTGFISRIVDTGVKAASVFDIPIQAISTSIQTTISFAKSISEGDFGSAFTESYASIGEGVDRAFTTFKEATVGTLYSTIDIVQDLTGPLADAIGLGKQLDAGFGLLKAPVVLVETYMDYKKGLFDAGFSIGSNLLEGDIGGMFEESTAILGETIGDSIESTFARAGGVISDFSTLIGLSEIPLVGDVIAGTGQGIADAGTMTGGVFEGFIASQGEVLGSLVTDPTHLYRLDKMVVEMGKAQLESWEKQGKILASGAEFIGKAFIESGLIGLTRSLIEGENFGDALVSGLKGTLDVFMGIMDTADRLLYQQWEGQGAIAGAMATALTGDEEIGQRYGESTAALAHWTAGVAPLVASVALPGVGGVIAGMVPTGAGEYDMLGTVLSSALSPILETIGVVDAAPDAQGGYDGPTISLIDAMGESILLAFPDGILEAVLASGVTPVEATTSISITAKPGASVMIVAQDSSDAFHFLPTQFINETITYDTMQKIVHNPASGSVMITTSSGLPVSKMVDGAIISIFCFTKKPDALPPEAIEEVGSRHAFEAVDCLEVITFEEATP